MEIGRAQAVPIGAAHRTPLYSCILELEREPISAIDDNPALNERGAAVILGLSEVLLKKWRQRGIGPNYLQYGVNGAVRYLLNDLMHFRAEHTIKTRSMPETVESRRLPRSKGRNAR